MNVRTDSKNIYMEAIGQNHNGVMQLLKESGWFDNKTKGAFPIIVSHTGFAYESNLQSVLCQLSDFFCDDRGWEMKSSSYFNPPSLARGHVTFYVKI